MQSKGIRILDKRGIIVSVQLSDILEEIYNGDLFHWSILDLYALGSLGEGITTEELEKKIKDSKDGLFITWNDLNVLSKKFQQIIDITILGCKNVESLHFYENDKKMYESCDIVIEMIDSGHWEVFSKEEHLIYKLVNKFNDIEFIALDSKV